MRMVDTDQVHISFAGSLVGGQQVLRAQFVTCGLRSLEGILQRQGDTYLLPLTVGRAEHGAAALAGISLAGMRHHGRPGFGFDADHSSSQKCSLRYLSALSHNTVTIIAASPRSTAWRATTVAACTLQPEEMPTSRPSSRAS